MDWEEPEETRNGLASHGSTYCECDLRHPPLLAKHSSACRSHPNRDTCNRTELNPLIEDCERLSDCVHLDAALLQLTATSCAGAQAPTNCRWCSGCHREPKQIANHQTSQIILGFHRTSHILRLGTGDFDSRPPTVDSLYRNNLPLQKD